MNNGGIISFEEHEKMINRIFKEGLVYHSSHEQIMSMDEIKALGSKLKLNENIPSMALKLYELAKLNSDNK